MKGKSKKEKVKRSSTETPRITFSKILRTGFLFSFLLFTFYLPTLFPFAFSFVAYTQSPQTAAGVVRLKVRYKSAEGTKDLPRKRFFLIAGSLEQNKSLIDKIKA